MVLCLDGVKSEYIYNIQKLSHHQTIKPKYYFDNSPRYITAKHNNATNSISAATIIPGVNILSAASGLREIPLTREYHKILNQNAAENAPATITKSNQSTIVIILLNN